MSSKFNKVAFVVRTGLTIMLLIIIWRNTHWSVALAITGLTLHNELDKLTKP